MEIAHREFDWSCVGFVGVAHAGKDEAAKALIEAGYTRHNLGDLIKRDLDELTQRRLGFSAFTEDPEQKKIIRASLEHVGNDMYDSYIKEYFDTMPAKTVSTRVQRAQEGIEWRKRNHPLILIQRKLKDGTWLQPATEFEAKTMEEIMPYITHTILNSGTLADLHWHIRHSLTNSHGNLYVPNSKIMNNPEEI